MFDPEPQLTPMPPRYEGRLELTWTNKNQRLLAHEDGSYEWVPPSDYRVAETRLLHDAGGVGEVHADERRSEDNLLIRGDALSALHSLSALPEFAREYVGKVRLCYIDPPFNTQQAFEQYDDALEHSVWLTMMRDRLLQVKTLLAADGSVWVHLDDEEMSYCKVLMDEVFGRDNFVGCVVWESAQTAASDTGIAGIHNYILVYAKDRRAWNAVRNPLPRDEQQLARFRNPDDDPRGPWLQGDNGTAKSGSERSRWPITTPSGRVVTPKEGRYWAFSKETFERARSEGRVYFGRKGDSLPIIKRYLAEMKLGGTTPKSWWPASDVGSSQEAKRDHLRKLFPDLEPFATPKPERLLHRIIHIASNPGDIVLDCFLGSATTAAVAHKMERRWVGIERSRETVEKYALPRLTKVQRNEDPLGVTATVGWQGGGSFRVLDVAPSMFEDDEGTIVIADWATNNKLAEATAAQFGYEYEPDAPFAGRKGRFRIAVIDGNVSAEVVSLLAGALGPQERLLVCGTSLDPDAAETLRKLSPGSEARKVPASILADYQLAHRWQAQTTLPDGAAAASSANGSEPAAATSGEVSA